MSFRPALRPPDGIDPKVSRIIEGLAKKMAHEDHKRESVFNEVFQGRGRVESLSNELAKALIRVFYTLFRPYFQLIEKIFEAIFPGVRIRLPPPFDLEENIDERIRKIDAARENLSDAILAVDELRREADENKLELERALVQIDVLRTQKESISAELDTLKQVASADTDAFRKLVGIPSRSAVWRERGLGFASGVIASVIASFIFLFLQRLI